MVTAEERHELLGKQAQQKHLEQRRLVRAQAAIAIGEAAAAKALRDNDNDDDDGAGGAGEEGAAAMAAVASAALTGAAAGSCAGGAAAALARDVAMKLASASPQSADALRMPRRVPGVQSRFENWRSANAQQREAALKSENAVLIGVLAERDAALLKSEAEMRKLKAEHHAMQTRWREATKAQQQQRRATTSAAAAATSAAAASGVAVSVLAEAWGPAGVAGGCSPHASPSPPSPRAAGSSLEPTSTPIGSAASATSKATCKATCNAASKAASKAAFLRAMEQAVASKQPAAAKGDILQARSPSAPTSASPRTPAGGLAVPATGALDEIEAVRPRESPA